MSNTNTNNSCGVFTVYPLGVTCVTTDATNGSNGTMEIFITGGTSPYNIEWSTGSNNVTQITNMVPGTYTATVTDFYGDFTDVASCVIGAPSTSDKSITITNAKFNTCTFIPIEYVFN